MTDTLEEILKDLHGKAGGKIALVLERFADGIECRVIVWEGAAPIYGSHVETRMMIFEDALSDDGCYVVSAARDHVRNACLKTPQRESHTSSQL